MYVSKYANCLRDSNTTATREPTLLLFLIPGQWAEQRVRGSRSDARESRNLVGGLGKR